MLKSFAKEHIFIGPYNTKGGIDKDLSTIQESLRANPTKVPVFITGENSNPSSEILLYLLRQLEFRRLLIESPSYNWHLMENKALDEFFINYPWFMPEVNYPRLPMPFSHIEHPHAELLTMGTHRSSFIFTRQSFITIHEFSRFK